MSIPLLNEVAKIKAGASTGGGSGTQFTKLVQKDKKRLAVSNFSASVWPEIGSIVYTKLMNHGGGQFSFCSIPYARYGATNTQFYVQPFTVNQTTGAITVGTAGVVWNNTSGNCQSTMNWGTAGSYGFNYGGHCAPGNASNTGTITAFTVTNNTVSGGTYATIGTSYSCNDNYESATTRSGSTAYFSFSNTNNGPYKTVYSYDGSSLTQQQLSSAGSNVGGDSVYYVVPQFGNTTATQGSLRFWRDNSYNGQIDVLNSTLSVSTTINLDSSLGIESYSTTNGIGIELSNGRQLFYINNTILLRSGSTITDVTATADWVPFFKQSPYRTGVVAVSADTWIAYSGTAGGEMVKFSINPTTYKVTNKGAFLIANAQLNGYWAESYITQTGGPYITGSNNQFVVSPMMYDSPSNAVVILVNEHSLTGA